MKSIKLKETMFSFIAASVLFTGCGSDNIDDVYKLSEDTSVEYTVKVVDDDIVNASLSANECTGYEEKGNGYYTLTGCEKRPTAIISTGGKIYINDTEIEQDFPLMLNMNMVQQSTEYTVTPLTTLLSTIDSYNDLKDMASIFGLDDVQELFTDKEELRDVQRVLNSFFIEAQNSGISLTNFVDFTTDLRTNIKAAKENGKSGTGMLFEARNKLKEDFDNNPDKYLKKYGIVFSGFVSETSYDNNNSGDLLKSIGEKFAKDTNQIVFSGFIYDDIIGSSNSELYEDNAIVTLKDLNTNTLILDKSTNTNQISTDNYGKWNIKFDKSDIDETHLYLLSGSIQSKNGNAIELNSVLTGSEILSKFKTKLNTSDLKDITISNVTSAKYACLQSKGLINLTDMDSIIEAKKVIESTDLEKLKDISGAMKTLIDGGVSLGTNQSIYDYTLSLLDENCNISTTEQINAVLPEMIDKIENDKTLNDQLSSTDYEKFDIAPEDIVDKRIEFKKEGSKYKSRLFVFKDNSYILREKDNSNLLSQSVGKWEVINGNLKLTNLTTSELTTLKLSSLSQNNVEFKNGNLNLSQASKGSILETNTFFSILNLNNIDYTETTAPIVEFNDKNIANKEIYEILQVSDDSFEDIKYNFSNNTDKTVTAEYDDQTLNKNWSTSNGILTIGSDTYKVINSFSGYIKCIKNNTSEVEFVYGINGLVTKVLRDYNYEGSPYLDNISMSNFWTDGINNNFPYNTISIDKSELTAVPIPDKIADFTNSDNYKLSKNYSNSTTSKYTTINSTKAFGFKTDMAVIVNNGDSRRQTASIDAKYQLTSCSTNLSNDNLVVSVIIQNDRVAYNLYLEKEDGSQTSLYNAPAPLTIENTVNKRYTITSAISDNELYLIVSDGINSYYQYAELETLWNSKSTILGLYNYPSSFNSLEYSAKLLDTYTGKSNSPITLKVYDSYILNGKEDDNYEEFSDTALCNITDNKTATSFGYQTTVAE